MTSRKMTRAEQSRQSQADTIAIERGEARILFNTWLLKGELQKPWFKAYYEKMVKIHGRDYAERIRGYMTLEREAHEKIHNAQRATGSPITDGLVAEVEASLDGGEKAGTDNQRGKAQP